MSRTRLLLDRGAYSQKFGLTGKQEPIKKEVVFGKGSFDLRKGGIHGMISRNTEAMEGSADESIPPPKNIQSITWAFEGASDEDWDTVYDRVMERDHYLSKYMWEWEMREPGKARVYAALLCLRLTLADIYLVNPVRDYRGDAATNAARSELKLKISKAAWWQESIRRMLFKSEVENVAVLKCIAASVASEGLSKFHVRSMCNTYLKYCMEVCPTKSEDVVKDLDLIYGGFNYALLELIGAEIKPGHIDACSHIGKAYGFMEMLKGLPQAKHIKSIMVPRDILVACKCDIGDFLEGRNTPGTRAVVMKLVEMMVGEMNQGIVAARSLSRHHRKILFYYPMGDLRGYIKYCTKLKFNILPRSEMESDYNHALYDFYRKGALLKRWWLLQSM
eukprot:TRINITY_DN8225_c0_g1_i1.p1 TRINITY_DN8225_c0_g1~~TRINITY_DN8225_c0_g1_i1.p1  ORF type:complete len:390 (+),score=32.90 TRINITY_DN8225_c0_g1_i1:49-1218(+)